MHPDTFPTWLPALALALSLPAHAAEWYAEPEVSLKSGYNDNIRLTTKDHNSVWETDLSPSVRFGVAKSNQGLSGAAGFAIRRFTGGDGRESSSILDREDYRLNTNAYHTAERDSYSANLIFTRDSTLDSGLDETGEVVDNRATRSRLTLRPSWARTLNEITELNLAYQFTNIDYSDEPEGSSLVEYENHILSSSLVRQFGPRYRGTLSASFSNYKPETGLESKTINLQAGLSRNFSETLVASFLAGQRRTTSDRLTPAGKDETDTSGSVYSASLTKILERGSLSASLSRATSPGSNGELLDTTRLLLAGAHRFTETLRSAVRIEYTENETIVNEFGREADQTKKKFFRIIPRLTWRWQPEWILAGEYQYAKSKDINSRTATRNALYLTLTYRQPKISISR